MRWEGDERLRGVAGTGGVGPDLATLMVAAGTAGWISEEPDQHLLPHLLAALETATDKLSLVSWRIDGASLELTLSCPDGTSARETRGAIFRLLGTVAESTTFVRETVVDKARRYEVCTGTLDGDGPFAGHGHTLRFVV